VISIDGEDSSACLMKKEEDRICLKIRTDVLSVPHNIKNSKGLMYYSDVILSVDGDDFLLVYIVLPVGGNK